MWSDVAGPRFPENLGPISIVSSSFCPEHYSGWSVPHVMRPRFTKQELLCAPQKRRTSLPAEGGAR